jgi:KDO2-lipid IV(A) lauroyltransferase
MEYFQYRGRGRSNKYMLGKKDVKGLIQALKDKETCVYLPDQDYGRKRAMFLPFFNVKQTATTTGTLIFTRQPNVTTLVIYTIRNTDGSGYHVTITPPLEDFPSKDDEADLIKVNQAVEKAILQQPEQYLWMHRRFKTRPDENDPSLYT